MNILKLLSEEVFDFSAGQMTETKIQELKASFTQEFSKVFDLCMLVLGSTQNSSLIVATLETLHRFLSWIPLGYIFDTPLIGNLIVNVTLHSNPTVLPGHGIS